MIRRCSLRGRRSPRRIGAPWLVISSILTLCIACSDSQQDSVSEVVEAVEEELGLKVHGFAPPEGLRPCCLLGTDMRVRVEGFEIPGYRERFVTSPTEIGAHGYGAGFLARDTSSGLFSRENNGQIYTCRGGFVDTAHIRDNADLTSYLYHESKPILETGGSFEIPLQGGRRILHLEPVSPEVIERVGRVAVLAEIAGWQAYQLSVWHEIATGYGWASIKEFPEYDSSFSPEDLYSNLTGIELARELIVAGRAETREAFDSGMDELIQRELRELGGLPHDVTHQAMEDVDGYWWDSSVDIPKAGLLRRRNFDFEGEIVPWQIPEERLSEELRSALEEHCGTPLPGPRPRRSVDELDGTPMTSYSRVEIRASGPFELEFPYPNAPSDELDQGDLRMLADGVRQLGLENLDLDDATQR